ncbi:stress responsive a/B barrel domain-containing protein [Purpureocillium lavendulum]|uniref:Stress responsive a/B barrel domain-containing protein n=1 Tax=Purpureocillium lavendulum TaxID=1247861 RepID=A0AB34FVB4_9HYPO|nr:stress responsive a/B barrel domain-containing protein [Purpureocillium lavendulum]
MTIYHIVLFAFKEGLSKEEIQAASEGMVTLEDKLIHPVTKKPYVKRIGGINNSPEGRAGGMTHGYICEFENEQDRKYYLEEDPDHKEWVQHVKPYLAGSGEHSIWQLAVQNKDDLAKLMDSECVKFGDIVSALIQARPKPAPRPA